MKLCEAAGFLHLIGHYASVNSGDDSRDVLTVC